MEKQSYEKYKWFFTSSGKLAVGGKNAEQNEEVIKKASKNDVVLHTAAPGSPFCIIKNPSKQDLEEVAVFTACFSHQWKKAAEENNKNKKVEVHVFRGSQIAKSRGMKTGAFGVAGKIETIKAELKLALDFQKSKLRALPLSAAKKPILALVPGKLTKEQAAEKISAIIKEKIFYPVKKDEIFAAIPSGAIELKEVK